MIVGNMQKCLNFENITVNAANLNDINKHGIISIQNSEQFYMAYLHQIPTISFFSISGLQQPLRSLWSGSKVVKV